MTDERVSNAVLTLGCRCLELAPSLGPHPSSSSVAAAFAALFHKDKDFSSSSSRDEKPAKGPFTGLVICVTGLSKDARKQVQAATEKMGGRYSPDLHPQCTHLVVQSFTGRKFEHALKHGLAKGLFMVTLSWFINSAKLNERLDETLFAIPESKINTGLLLQSMGEEKFCLPMKHEENKVMSLPWSDTSKENELIGHHSSIFDGFSFYLDSDLPNELQTKVLKAAASEGATFIEDWFIGCNATHVVCEGTALLKYIGYNTNLVTPFWVLKSAKERNSQRVVQFSADLARHLAFLVDYSRSNNPIQIEDVSEGTFGRRTLALCGPSNATDLQSCLQEREAKVAAAKAAVRRRRGPRMQPCRTLPRPITPASLLDTVCWSVTESPLSARFYVDPSFNSGTLTGSEVDHEQASVFFDANESERDQDALSTISESEVCSRPMTQSERQEVIYKGVFLTILYPLDRFAELGASSHSYFSENGFTREQILYHIYSYYQDFLSEDEIEVAIHTDSRHADRLRTLYATKEAVESGQIRFKRCDFLGSRRSFEGLKRVSRENVGQVYELWLVGS